MKQVALLGATGSIGESTLKLIKRHPEQYQLSVATANTSVPKMLAIIEAYSPKIVVMVDEQAANTLRSQLVNQSTEVLSGTKALEQVSSDASIDTVVAGIVGLAGLPAVAAAARAGKRILLANKEALVVTGDSLMKLVKEHDACLLPTDSEHFAMWECMPSDFEFGLWHQDIKRLVLTASGGPFRGYTKAQLAQVSPQAATDHPTWSMGPKISTDSATLVNKGLELIEACWLFGAKPKDIEVVVHPQSIVHSMVDYVDGQTLAHLGLADMCVPINRGLSWPQRTESGVQSIDWLSIGQLTFEAPDEEVFPAIKLARQSFDHGGAYCLALNAANEVAVAAFLAGRISFVQIIETIESVLAHDWQQNIESLELVYPLDMQARSMASAHIARHPL